MNSTLARRNPIPKDKRASVGRERTIRILRIVALGALMLSIGAAPSPKAVGKILKELLLDDSREERRYVYRKVRELKNRGLLERRGVAYAVSDKGRGLLVRNKVENAAIPRQKHWTGKWYLLMFDIPVSESGSRKSLNRILLRMGLVQYQQSVFVYPFPFKETVLPVCRLLMVTKYVSFASVYEIDGADKLKRVFGI